jgi:ABC-type sulfate/molybdate transport systems ATPase subunit
VGPSGAGKTTVLRAIAGAVTPREGRIDLGDRTLLDRDRRIDLPPEERRVGYVFQEYALFPHMTVRQNVAFAGAERADELMERFGITHLADARPGALSGGERQRVGLARALAGEPEVLLFDEPLSALDAQTRDRVRGELAELLARLALPALLVTHDFADAAALADRVGVMSRGTVLQMGTPAELLRAPADAFVARFAGSNMMAGAARRAGGGMEVVLEGGAVVRAPDGPEGPVGAVVHPWDVAIVADDAVPEGHNHIRAPIASVAPDGDRVRVRVGPLVAVVDAAAASAMGLVPGGVVTAAWAPERTRLVRR